MVVKPPPQVVIETPAPVRPDVELPAWVEDLTSLSALDFTVGLGGFSVAAMMPDPVVTIPLALAGMFAFKVLRDTPVGSHARKAVVRTVRSLRAPERKTLPGRARPARRGLPFGSASPSPVRRTPKVVVHRPGQTHNPSPRRPRRTEDGLVHTRPSGVRGASPQTWPPIGKPLPDFETVLAQFDGLPVAVVGGTGSGKTSVMSRLAAHRIQTGAVVMAVAYHYDPERDAWPDGVHIVGAGYRRSEGDLAMYLALTEMVARYRLASRRSLPAVPRIYVFVDEWKAVSQRANIAAVAVRLVNEGRKAGVIGLLTPHTPTVTGMKLEGGVRDAFRFIVLPETPPKKYTRFPRVVDVWAGKPEAADARLLGQYIAREPVKGRPDFGIPSGCWALAYLDREEVESVIRDAELPYPRGGQDAVDEALLRWWAQERQWQSGQPLSGTPPVPSGTPPVRPGTPPVRALSAGHTLSGTHPVRDGTHPVPTFEQFTRTFSPNSAAEMKLILALLKNGFSQTKVADFLPSKSAPARERVQAVAARYGINWKDYSRPAAGSDAERTLIVRLYSLGADVRRIAKLLDGNTAENRTRINGILFRNQ